MEKCNCWWPSRNCNRRVIVGQGPGVTADAPVEFLGGLRLPVTCGLASVTPQTTLRYITVSFQTGYGELHTLLSHGSYIHTKNGEELPTVDAGQRRSTTSLEESCSSTECCPFTTKLIS